MDWSDVDIQHWIELPILTANFQNWISAYVQQTLCLTILYYE